MKFVTMKPSSVPILIPFGMFCSHIAKLATFLNSYREVEKTKMFGLDNNMNFLHQKVIIKQVSGRSVVASCLKFYH